MSTPTGKLQKPYPARPLGWLLNYRKNWLSGDIASGLTVSVVVVPQAMAYAMLAGVPPRLGLYAALLPPIAFALLGASRALAVGPVAIVALLTASAVSVHATPETPEFIAIAATLALLVGLLQILMGALRAGFLANFLSRPVVAGFTTAAALMVLLSQVNHLMGVKTENSTLPWEMAYELVAAIPQVQAPTLAIGLSAVAALILAKKFGARVLGKLGIPKGIASFTARMSPLLVVAATTAIVAGWHLDTTQAVSVVGDIPQGLPALGFDHFRWDMLQTLTPSALAIVFVIFLEMSAVLAIAEQRRGDQPRMSWNVASVGAGNVLAGMSTGFPISGGFSRSMVLAQSGANSGLALLIYGCGLGAILLWLTPLLFWLPKATLAAIVVTAVLPLLDLKTLKESLRYSKADSAGYIITFCGVIGFGVEVGIELGAGASLVFYLWRTTRLRAVEVGRLENSEHFRSVRRFATEQSQRVLMLRIDESLWYGNARVLRDQVLAMAKADEDARHVVLVVTGVNSVDITGLYALRDVREGLENLGKQLSLADMRAPVLERLERAGYVKELEPGRVFLSANEAFEALSAPGSGSSRRLQAITSSKA